MKGYKKLLISGVSSFVILTCQLSSASWLEVKFLGIIQEELKVPAGVTTEPSWKIFIADKDKHQVLVFDKDGKFINGIGEKGKNLGQFNQPVDLAVYKDRLYVL